MNRVISSRLFRPSWKPVHAGCAVIAVAAAAVLLSLPAVGQQRPAPPPRPIVPTMDPFNMPPVSYGDPMRMKQDAKRLAYLNAERQKTLVAQTNRLLKLASELHAQINGDQHTPLTADQIRQFQEIEKLAHNIRDKMSSSLMPAPSFDSGGPPYFPR